MMHGTDLPKRGLEHDDYNVRHVAKPCYIIHLVLDDGTGSMMLSYPWVDIDERLQRYVDGWNNMFDRKISVVSKELIK